MKLKDCQLKFESLNGSPNPITEDIKIFMISYWTKLTLKKHFLETHILIGNNINYHLEKCSSESFIRRLLVHFSVSPYLAIENGCISLIESGFALSSNLTSRGILAYIENQRKLFDFNKEWYLLDKHQTTSPEDLKKVFNNSPIMKDMCTWWIEISDHCERFVNMCVEGYNNNECDCINVVNDMKTFLCMIEELYPNTITIDVLSNSTPDLIDNTIRICTMILFTSIYHEIGSNPYRSKIISNPFIFPTCLQKGGSLNEIDHIRGAQILTGTSLKSFLLGDDASSVSINAKEMVLFKLFSTKINSMTIETKILEPENIESSTRW